MLAQHDRAAQLLIIAAKLCNLGSSSLFIPFSLLDAAWKQREPRGRGWEQSRDAAEPTFAFALVHHFQVGVVSALGRQQVALITVGVAIRAADLQLAGQAGAIGGAGTLGPAVLHLAHLVGAAHHPLTALWGQKGAQERDSQRHPWRDTWSCPWAPAARSAARSSIWICSALWRSRSLAAAQSHHPTLNPARELALRSAPANSFLRIYFFGRKHFFFLCNGKNLSL